MTERPDESRPFDSDHVGCCIVPQFVTQQVGIYTHRIVLDSLPRAGFVSEEAVLPDGVLECHYERLPQPVPKMGTVLRWVAASGRST